MQNQCLKKNKKLRDFKMYCCYLNLWCY